MFQQEDRETLQELLEIKRPEMSIQVAARAGLRVLPLLEEIPGADTKAKAHRVALAAFRAAQLSLAAGLEPRRAREFAELAGSVTDDHAEHHLYSGDAAAKAIEFAIGSVVAGYRHARAGLDFGIVYSDPLSDAHRAAHLASNAADPRVSDLYQDSLLAAAFDDARLLLNGRSGASMGGKSLWLSGQPGWVAKVVERLAARLESAGNTWSVWTRWYEAILRGDPMNLELEYELATIPREVWRRGAAETNAEVQRIMDSYVQQPAQRPRETSFDWAEEETDLAADKPVETASGPKSRVHSKFGWGIGTDELARRIDDMEMQLADLSDRISREIEVQNGRRPNDELALKQHAQNIAFLDNLRSEVDSLYIIANDLPGEPDAEATDNINRKGRTLVDILESYATWIAGEENAREIANGVLIGGVATIMLQLNWAPLPVTTAAIALIGGPRLKGHLEKLIAQVRGTVTP